MVCGTWSKKYIYDISHSRIPVDIVLIPSIEFMYNCRYCISLLFESTWGFSGCYVDTIILWLVVESVLESILSTEACKGGLPTIAALLTHPFFNSTELAYSHHLTNPSQSDRPHLKFSSHVKEALKVARQKIEIRLKDEQKMVQRITTEYMGIKDMHREWTNV